jgi:hypothetical protein
VPATAFVVAARVADEASSELVVPAEDVLDCAVVEAVLVGSRLATAMPPVKPNIAATLSHPANRRAPPAGCGRLRERFGAGIGSLLGSGLPSQVRRDS